MGINMEFYVKITPQGDLFTIFIISLVCFLMCPNLSSEWDFPLAFFMFVEAVGELLTGFCAKKIKNKHYNHTAKNQKLLLEDIRPTIPLPERSIMS